MGKSRRSRSESLACQAHRNLQTIEHRTLWQPPGLQWTEHVCAASASRRCLSFSCPIEMTLTWPCCTGPRFFCGRMAPFPVAHGVVYLLGEGECCNRLSGSLCRRGTNHRSRNAFSADTSGSELHIRSPERAVAVSSSRGRSIVPVGVVACPASGFRTMKHH